MFLFTTLGRYKVHFRKVAIICTGHKEFVVLALVHRGHSFKVHGEQCDRLDISRTFTSAWPTANGSLSAANSAQTEKALPLRRKERV